MKKKRFCLWLLPLGILLLSLSGCDKADEPRRATRTVLAYIIADNSLSRYAPPDVDAMIEGLAAGDDASLNLLVYQDNYSEPPTLWKIEKKGRAKAEKVVIKEYTEQNSVDKTLMSSIIREAFALYPADERGLVLWSHGSGWIPSSNYTPQKASASGPQRAFGQDGDNWLELWDIRTILASAGVHFNFILFDACHMANVEVAYELRNCTDYLIASSAEIMGDGFPYESVIPLMNRQKLDLREIGKAYMAYYDGSNDYLGGTISVIHTQKLPELAQLYATVLAANTRTATELQRAQIQEFGRWVSSTTSYHDYFFDMEQTVSAMTPEYIGAFNKLLKDIVVFEGHTPTFGFTLSGGEKFDIASSCGLTVFIPVLNTAPTLQSAYAGLQWYEAVYK